MMIQDHLSFTKDLQVTQIEFNDFLLKKVIITNFLKPIKTIKIIHITQ